MYYFCAGLTEELFNNTERLPDLTFSSAIRTNREQYYGHVGLVLLPTRLAYHYNFLSTVSAPHKVIMVSPNVSPQHLSTHPGRGAREGTFRPFISH